MSDQGGHAPVSNEPETTGQFGVTKQVSESSFRGEHDERVQKGHEVAEATLGYRRPETGLAQLSLYRRVLRCGPLVKRRSESLLLISTFEGRPSANYQHNGLSLENTRFLAYYGG